jgi:hypothetical protein
MKTISSFVILMALFFMGTTGIVYIMTDIGANNNNLDDDSLEMLSSLNQYQLIEEKHRFSNNQVNYSLTGYEDTDAEDKDNVESKGTLSIFLFLSDSFSIIPTFMNTLLPFFPVAAFAWIQGIVLSLMSMFFTIAIYNAWKSRRV